MVPLLRLERLCKDFGSGSGRIRVLSDIDLDVCPGETVGIVGESGCGKTTLARCALRLLEPTSGTIEFDGQDLRRLTPPALRRKRREFQFIFQDALASLDPRMTVREILLEPYQAHRLGNLEENQVRVSGLLQAVSLDGGIADRYPRDLSGGQQQRVGLARALALRPRLLIADEPVSSLDASVQAQILNLLADLQKSFGLTLILIAHSLAVVHYLCTRVVVIYLGRIVEDAPAAVFFAGPRHPYSRLLLAASPGRTPSQCALSQTPAGELPSLSSPPPGCPFHTRCPQALERCHTLRPQLTAQEDHTKVACFLYT